MPATIVPQRSLSLSDLPVQSVLKAKNIRVNIQPKNNGLLKVDLSFDEDQSLLREPNEPTPALKDDVPPNYDELEKQVKILNRDKNLEKWLKQSRVKLPEGVDVSAVKDKLREFEKRFAKDDRETKDNNIPYYEHLKAKLRALNEEDHLEQWLETLEHKPKDVSLIKQTMQDYFKMQAKSIPGPQAKAKPSLNPSTKSSHQIPGKLWERFMEMPPLQKTAVVVGITVVAAGVGILTWTLIGAAFPPVLVMVQGQLAGFFVEFSFEMNRLRNEVSFNLLALTADQAKPLSRAWRDQFLIWKYI